MPPAKDLFIPRSEIVTDDRHETHRSKKTGRHREIRRCATYGPVHLSVWAFERIKRYRTDYE
jgi:hypothetical protein